MISGSKSRNKVGMKNTATYNSGLIAMHTNPPRFFFFFSSFTAECACAAFRNKNGGRRENDESKGIA
jgi:hypothetical protein